MQDKRVALATCFYHFGDLVVPAATGNPRIDAGQKCLVMRITGRGQVDALCYHTNYYGVWFGCQVDDYPLVMGHNGHCLVKMGLVGPSGNGMPCYLPFYNNENDLAVAMRSPIRFDREFRLWVGNSHPTEPKLCSGLHVYASGRDIEPVEGNLLDWTLILPERHPHTRLSADTITLQPASGKDR